jgi:hypothetical protein
MRVMSECWNLHVIRWAVELQLLLEVLQEILLRGKPPHQLVRGVSSFLGDPSPDDVL